MKRCLCNMLACPVCRRPLEYEGTTADERLTKGTLRCEGNHVYQVKDEIPILKDPKTSGTEFSWNVEFPNLERYESIRREYDSYLPNGLKKADEDLKDEIIREVHGCGLVLDVASGMGALLTKMASQTDKRTEFLGTDVDEKPLRGARLKLQEIGAYDRVSLCVMDGKRLTLKDGRTPCVTSFFGFDNIPNAKVAFQEARQILMLQGRLIFATLSLEEGSESLAEAEKRGLGAIATEDRLAEVLGSSGFKFEAYKQFFSGRWAHNPMDLLPFENDWFAHSFVSARKE